MRLVTVLALALTVATVGCGSGPYALSPVDEPTHDATPFDGVAGGYLEIVIPWADDTPTPVDVVADRSSNRTYVGPVVDSLGDPTDRYRMLRVWSVDPVDGLPGEYAGIGLVCLDTPGSSGSSWGWESTADRVRLRAVPGLQDSYSVEYDDQNGVTVRGYVRFAR